MRKLSNGRLYHHEKTVTMNGTSIMVNVGSPNKCREHGTIPYEKMKLINGDEQLTNRLEYIPFVHKPVSGKKSAENFKQSLKNHDEKVAKALEKYSKYEPHVLHDVTKSSKTVNRK